MDEMNLYKLVSVIRHCLGEPESMFTDEEIRSYLNEGYARTHNYGRIKELTLERLRAKLG